MDLQSAKDGFLFMTGNSKDFEAANVKRVANVGIRPIPQFLSSQAS